MQDKKVLTKNSDMVTRAIEDETILLPIYKTSDEINCIYTLNKVASRIWELIDGKKTLAGIKRQVLKEFDTTPEEVDKEMKKFLKDLEEIKAVK
ncbi:MAG: PqqD family protein [Candidatus Omnitrophica bacterium]|nr:PqqD family protein [Candidatus Omnitrophota bacterium]MBU4468539.1 PqqD family protein [Candidatus Omnitrophota bacterium]MCG2707754.1 PqqD family protein [Candidatus Omnitrophota bacterium]